MQELERSAAPETSALPRPRLGSGCQERRVRRGNDHRFLTQPITCEEIVAIRWGSRAERWREILALAVSFTYVSVTK